MKSLLFALSLASVETALQEELEETRTPGAALVIVQGDDVVFAKGFGVANVETRESVTPDHLFRLGSTTKLFTALALATLAEQGRIDLTRPVGEVAPNLPDFASGLTAHQLLSHTSGLKDEPADFGLHDESALAVFPRGWGKDYRLAAPGTGFSYSNPGFALAGLLIEEILKKPFADGMKDLLLAPLGMERATFRPTEAMTRALAQGHRVPNDGPVTVVRPYSDDARQWPNGFLMASASELARFAIAFLNGGRLEGKGVLSPGAIERVSTAHAEIPYDLPDMKKPRYGYGLFLHERDGVPLFEHVGTMPGFTSILTMAPTERFAVILLANQEGIRFEKTLGAALSPFRRETPSTETAPPAVSLTESEMDSVTGVYRNRWPVTLVRDGGSLFLDQFGGHFPVTRRGADRFEALPPGDRPPIPFRILSGADGKSRLLQMFLWLFKKDEVAP